jgi:hypothetical protein
MTLPPTVGFTEQPFNCGENVTTDEMPTLYGGFYWPFFVFREKVKTVEE